MPDVIPWKRLSNAREQSLLKSMDKISGQVTDDHRSSTNLCHTTILTDNKPSQGYDRGGNPFSDDESARIPILQTLH